MSISKVLNYILIVTVLIALSACSSKGGGGDTNTSTPIDNTPTDNTPIDNTPTDNTPTDNTPTSQEEALTSIASFISGGTAPTLTDYTNAGVTGVTVDNIDSINNLISDTSSPTKTPTTTQIQSVINIIQGSSTPTDYDVLGITGVTATNISNINSILTSKDIVDINSVAKIDNIVKTTDKLMAGTTLSVDDYSTLGITGVDSNNLSGINQEIASKTASEVDTIEEIKAIVDEFINRANSVTGDETPPVIVLNGDSTVVVYQGKSYTDAGAVVKDNVDANRTIYSSDSVDTTVVASYTLRYDANDSSNNSAIQVTRTVNVVDISTPTIIITDDTNTTEYGSSYSDKGAIALDGVGNLLVVTTTGADFNTTILGEHNVTYTAVNGSGIKSTKIRTVTVVDTTPPTITINRDTNGNIDMNISHGSSYTEYGASISDNVDTNLNLNISGAVDTTTLGVYVISYNAKDTKNNEAIEQNRTVRVVDTTAPIIFIKGSNPYYLDYNTTYSDEGAYATDNVDTNKSVSGFININPNQLGEYNITYNHTDSHGNIAIPKVRRVIVVDRVPPTIDIIGDNPLRIEAPNGTYTEYNATVTDNVDSGLIATISGENDVYQDIVGEYIVTYFAKDNSDNNTTEIRTVIVEDTTPPTINITGDNPLKIVRGDSYTEYDATATDDYDDYNNLPLNKNINSSDINISAEGNYTVIYRFTDSSGNIAEANRTVEVGPNTDPTITAKDINLTEGDRIDTNSSGIDINASDIDDNDNITWYYIKEGNTTIYSSNTLADTLSPLPIGEHNLSIVVTDSHETNSTEANITVVVKIGESNVKKTGNNTTLAGVKYDDNYYRAGTTFVYSKDANANVIDTQNELVWEDNETVTKPWNNRTDINNTALAYCSNFGEGNNAWRIPTRKELFSLVNYGNATSFIDSNFTNTQTGLPYWTVTPNATDNTLYWGILFETGTVSNNLDATSRSSVEYYIRCVKDTNTTPRVTDANFREDVNGTVIDYNTMLEWQDNNISIDMNWTKALDYCHKLQLSPIEGIVWRLPNINELASIVDDTTASPTSPAIDGNFTKTEKVEYWSSTYVGENIYTIDFDSGILYARAISRNDSYKTRCVRTRRKPSFYQ